MKLEELRELFAVTVELTRMRQAECKHLCIENFAPELLGKLLRERRDALAAPDDTLRKDAERYRWLRAHGEPDNGLAYRSDWAVEMYDDAIDAAMALVPAVVRPNY